MEKIPQAVEVANEAQISGEEAGSDVRTLKDLELVLAGGGGDGMVTW